MCAGDDETGDDKIGEDLKIRMHQLRDNGLFTIHYIYLNDEPLDILTTPQPRRSLASLFRRWPAFRYGGAEVPEHSLMDRVQHR